MKSKKWIAPAMMGMALISLSGSLLSQSTDTVSPAMGCSLTSFTMVESVPTLNADSLIMDNLPSVSEEIEQMESIFTVMANQNVNASQEDETIADEIEVVEDSEVVENSTIEETATVEETTEAPKPNYVIPCSDNEFWLLCRLIEAEAGDTDVTGRIIVANVIINRVKDGYFPNTITDVVYSAGQFMPITTGVIWQVNVDSISIEAVTRALYGEDYSQGATYFCSTASAAKGNWHSRALTRLFEYGGNVFYKK